jgi:hypothetical protein
MRYTEWSLRPFYAITASYTANGNQYFLLQLFNTEVRLEAENQDFGMIAFSEVQGVNIPDDIEHDQFRVLAHAALSSWFEAWSKEN